MTRRQLLVGILLLIIAVFAVSHSAFAVFGKNKIVHKNLEWRIYETEHFNIYFYRGSEELLPEIAEIAEEAYRNHSEKMNFDLSQRVPFIMYRNQREFQQTNILLGDISEGIGGFSEIVHNRMVLPVDGSKVDMRQLIYHELTHIFQYEIIFHNVLGQALNNVPDWFIEGHAAHMEGAWDSFGLMVLRDAVLNGTVPDLMDIHNFAYLSSPFYGYRLGQSALDYLVDRFGYRGLQKLLWEMSKSQTKDMKTIIKKAFDISYEEFNDGWKTDLKQKFWNVGVKTHSPIVQAKLFHLPDHDERRGTQYFQTSLSPSGDILAVLSTRRGELDINLIDSHKGRFIRNLTKDYQGTKYELIIGFGRESGRNLSWSPTGDSIIFSAKKEGQNILFIINALDGRIIRELPINLNNVTSPIFSPDGQTVFFAAYDDSGQSDIFSYDLSKDEVQRITNDSYIDEYPALSPNGQQLVYSSERGEFFQLVVLSDVPTGKEILLTDSPYNHFAASWSYDNEKIVYIGDENLINNIYELDLFQNQLRRLTQTYGGFSLPQYNSNNNRIYFEAYYEGRFRIGYLEYPEIEEKDIIAYEPPASKFARSFDSDFEDGPAGIVKGDRTFTTTANLDIDNGPEEEQNDLLAYLDEQSDDQPIEGKKVKFRLLPDAGYFEAQYRTDGIFYGIASIFFSDILGDHRFNLQLYSVQDLSSLRLSYYNLKNRFNYGVSVFDLKDFTYYYDERADLRRYQEGITGVSSFIEYPFNRYHRVEFELSRYQYSHDGFPVYDASANDITLVGDVVHQHLTASIAFVRDTVRYRYFGPYMGSAFRVEVSKGIQAAKDYQDYLNYYWDFRAYQRVSPRTLIAARLAGAMSSGDDLYYYSYGGGTTLRGYEYRERYGTGITYLNLEYRFPVVDILHISFLGTFTNIRGAFYWDFGTDWIDGQSVNLWDDTAEKGFHFVDLQSAYGMGLYWQLGFFELRFDWSRKTDLHSTGDWIYEFSIGRSF